MINKLFKRIKTILFAFILSFFILPFIHSLPAVWSSEATHAFLAENQHLIYKVHAEEQHLYPTYPDGFSPNASTLHPQWNHNVMNIGEAWADGYTGAGVKIAILDTGFFHRHPDISLAGGYSVFPDDPWSNDHSGHGTHIAGIIAANRGTPYQGVAPDAEVYGIKIYHSDDVGEDGEVSTDVNSVIRGIRQAMAMEADIIVISSGLSYHDENLYAVIRAAYEADILIIAASGNGNVTVNYPANYSEVLAITAVDERLNPAVDIIYGQENDFSAPGVNIGGLSIPESTYSYPYIFMSGSSQATPHAAGLAAILMQKHGVRGQEIRSIMEQTAINIGDSGLFGHGLLYYQSSQSPPSDIEDLVEPDEDDGDDSHIVENNSNPPAGNTDEDDSDVRKPSTSREADSEDEEDPDYRQVAVTPNDQGLGEITGNAFLLVQPRGTIELMMDQNNSVRLTQEQVFELRNNNISLILSKDQVSWKIPPANFVPGAAVLRFYSGRPIGIEPMRNAFALEQTISIFQSEIRREVYPGWMEIQFDLSEMTDLDKDELRPYYFEKSTRRWHPSDSRIEDDLFTLRTRHTTVVGFYDILGSLPQDSAEDPGDLASEADTEEAEGMGRARYILYGVGAVIVIIGLSSLRVYFKKR